MTAEAAMPPATGPFTAIDFETGDPQRDSACAVAVVRVEDDVVVARHHWLLRPPRPIWRRFTDVHGITTADVRRAPTFAEVWPQLWPYLAGADFLAAHNAGFDRSVLAATSAAHGLTPPATPFVCTVRLARDTWGIRPTTLDRVCRHLDIPLLHHQALSDAEACAAIVLHARGARR